MDIMNITLQCVLVFFTLYVQEALSEDFEAHLGEKVNLQVNILFYFHTYRECDTNVEYVYYIIQYFKFSTNFF